TLSSYAADFAGDIGGKAAAAKTRSETATVLAQEAESRRTSAEGVNMDEELVNMTTFQQAYNASARLIQASRDMYDSALLNLMNAQSRAQLAQERIASEKIATDMTGYGRGAEQLTSLTSTQTRIEGFIGAGQSAAARLSAQDLAMTRVYDAGAAARDAIANGIAAGNITSLMTELGLQYQDVQGGLNAEHQGSYLFAGARTDSKPVTAATMADLAAAPSNAS
ncbi:hypothetical protein LTR94_029646, partial [Friedmanniomyces endolithicus]